MGMAAKARALGWMVLALALLAAGLAGALAWRAGEQGGPAADAGALRVALPAAVEAGPVTWRVARAEAAVTRAGRGLLTLTLRPELDAASATPILHLFTLLENNRAEPGRPEQGCLASVGPEQDAPACSLEFAFALDAALTLAVEDPYSEVRAQVRVVVAR
jgi:hypothetical protein